MSLPLHTIVTRDEALAGLTGGAPPEVLRGGEFATAPGLVLGFLRPAALTFRSPTTIEWGPGETRDPPPWMLAPPRRPLPKYHLLLEEPGGWFYAGYAHLGSYRTDGSEATFTLSAPLPRGAWVRLGGYPHWLVELNHEEHRLGPDEEAKLRALLRRVIAPPHGHLTLTRYEEDSLQL